MRLRHSLSLAFHKKIKCIILIDKRIKTSAAVYGKYHTKGGFIMEYRRFGNTIYLRLDPKEEILEEIGKVAKKRISALHRSQALAPSMISLQAYTTQ